MEALQRLQAMHTTLGLMQDYALCSNGSSQLPTPTGSLASDQFLADFFAFLGKTGANAGELKERCATLMNTLPKVSVAFLQALVAENVTLGGGQDAVKVPTTGCQRGKVSSQLVEHTYSRCDEKDSTMILKSENIHGYKLHTRNSPPREKSKELQLGTPLVPMVGLKAMERASTTLEDFLDEQNEEQVSAHNSGCEVFVSNSSNQDSQGAVHSLVDKCCQDAAQRKTCYANQDCFRESSSRKMLGTHLFSGLEQALADQRLLTERIISELRDGLEYWKLEYSLCEALRTEDQIFPGDIFTATRLKSFDYRVLNLLLYSLTDREVNEAHFNFLAVSELLVEISDDLYDYEDDVLKNSFNVLRMLVNVYGPARAPGILAKFISEQEMRYEQLLDRLEPGLARCYRERCKEATQEGGGGSKYQFGSWTIPPLIVDEEAFRKMHLASAPQK